MEQLWEGPILPISGNQGVRNARKYQKNILRFFLFPRNFCRKIVEETVLNLPDQYAFSLRLSKLDKPTQQEKDSRLWARKRQVTKGWS
jgi:hypothetical protein